MASLYPFIVVLFMLPSINAVNVWGGVNSYFLHAVSASDRAAHLSAMRDNGVKVVRIIINGVDAGAKSSSAVELAELEPNTVGVYNDEVLNKIDVLMYEASTYGVKLLIAMHDRYSLGCWRKDAYVSKYNLQDVSPDCTGSNLNKNQPKTFYTDANAQADFDRRIAHILTHKNSYFGNRQWREISEAVFGFEPENEAQGHMDDSNTDWNWACRRAATMKKYISNGILIVTGGGNTYDNSMVDNHFRCSNIDVVAIHDYDVSKLSTSQLSSAKSKAAKANKRLIVEEFGNTGVDASRASTLYQVIDAAVASGIPWMPWEFVKPGNNQNDYEFWTGGYCWQTVSCFAKKSLVSTGAFTWPSIGSSGGSKQTCSNYKDEWAQCALSSECKNFCCSKEYSGDGAYKCTPGSSQCLKLSDWQFCSKHSQCSNSCCTNKYSDDGKYKCTPNGC